MDSYELNKIAGAVLGGIGAIFQPPSITRLMGLPF